MPTLVLLRHGQSQWNLENRFTGWWDVDLSDKGIAEARAAGILLSGSGFEFDHCFTCVQTRAIRTLHLVLHEMDRLWLPVTKDWRLNERHYGGLTGLNKQEMIDKVGAEQVKIWRRSFDIPPPPLPADSPYTSPATAAMPASRCPRPRASRTRSPGCCPITRRRSRRAWLRGERVIVSAHGNSLRALEKHLSNIGDDRDRRPGNPDRPADRLRAGGRPLGRAPLLPQRS